MKKPAIRKPLALLIGGMIAAASFNAQSAGFAIIEQSASGMGNAFAGAAAVAEDASTIFFNPAGMTNLQGSQLVAAGHIIVPGADFNNDGSYVNPLLTGGAPFPGSLPGSDDDGGETAFVPNLYFSTQLSDQLFAGIGINAPFGLATKYDNDWVGRYHALRSEISTININPSLAYKVNDRISLGGGISAQYIRATLSNAVDFGSVCFGLEGRGFLPPGTCSGAGVLPLQADGQAKVKGSDWGFGFNLGAMIHVTDHTRIGLAYRSHIEQDLEGDATFRVPDNFQAILNIGLPLFSDTGVTAGVDLPESASLSLYHAFNDQWAVLADATWTKWSRFEELRIEYDNPAQPDTVQPENWDNNMRYSIGATYRPSQKWVFRVGAAYDETPINKTVDRTPRIPGNDRKWIAIGLGYRLSDNLSMDAGYSHLFIEDTDLDALDHSTGHQLIGTYESDVNIFSAQLNYKF
jgi:long-chain fatty acid transport protein